MKSKEALETIGELNFYEYDELTDRTLKEEYKEEFEILEKDLVLLETLKKYKELEEQGRLIILPCKKGDKIYILNFPYVTADEIEKISINYETRTEHIKEYQIGTYAFFNREAAETLLEHMKEWLENEQIK